MNFIDNLQSWSYSDHECKLTDFLDGESELYHIVSQLSHANNNNTLYIKGKWERESGIEISEESWGNIWFNIQLHGLERALLEEY